MLSVKRCKRYRRYETRPRPDTSPWKTFADKTCLYTRYWNGKIIKWEILYLNAEVSPDPTNSQPANISPDSDQTAHHALITTSELYTGRQINIRGANMIHLSVGFCFFNSSWQLPRGPSVQKSIKFWLQSVRAGEGRGTTLTEVRVIILTGLISSFILCGFCPIADRTCQLVDISIHIAGPSQS